MIDEGNPAELKASLLSKGIHFDMDLFRRYDGQFYDNQFVYGRTSKGVMPEHRFPQVIQLGDGVISALLRRENSPWNLRIEDNIVRLYHQDRYVQDIGLPERPAYFGKRLSDGTPSESVIAVAGQDTPGFFLYPECFYFEEGEPCGFCSMKNTRKTAGKHMASDFTEEGVAEATKLFQNTRWRDIPIISVTTGTPRTDQETRDYVLKMIKTMYDALDPKIPIHVLAHPPEDLGVVGEYRDAGVTSIAFNLEAFDREAFGKVCPGKQRFYGYDKWLDALEEAKDVFGEYKAFCGLVWGLEPTESSMAGNEYLLERGFGIASNIFHADANSVMAKHPHPTEEDIVRIAKHEHQLYLDHPEARTIFPVSMRSTVDWEARRGDFS
jgi:hypothetical protein